MWTTGDEIPDEFNPSYLFNEKLVYLTNLIVRPVVDDFVFGK
jgi:hypothetical protein